MQENEAKQAVADGLQGAGASSSQPAAGTIVVEFFNDGVHHHRSGGKVSLDVGDYDDDEIARIHARLSKQLVREDVVGEALGIEF